MPSTSTEYSKKKNRRRRIILRMTLSLLSLAVLTVFAVLLIEGGGKLNFGGVRSLLGGGAGVSAFYFDDGKSGAFADLGGAFASIGPLGVQVFDNSGNEIAKETVAIKDPTMCSAGDIAVAYDLGGTVLMPLDKSGVKAKITTDFPIISASVNKNGWCAVSTQETGFKGRVAVYDPSGALRYKWSSGSGYVLAASVTNDGKSMAALTLTDSGSRIVFYDLNSKDEKASYTVDGELLLDIRFQNDGLLTVVGKDALYTIGRDGKELSSLDYGGKFLKSFDLGGDGFVVLCISDYQVGGQGTIETVGENGEVIGRIDGLGVAVSAKGNYIGVLQADSVTIYDRAFGQLGTYSGLSGPEGVLMRADGSALVTKAGSAVVYSIK